MSLTERERESEWKCDYASSYCPFPTASLCALFRVCAFVCISLYLCLTRHEFTHICTAFAFIYLGGTSCADDARRFTEDKQIFSLVYQPFGLGRQINQIFHLQLQKLKLLLAVCIIYPLMKRERKKCTQTCFLKNSLLNRFRVEQKISFVSSAREAALRTPILRGLKSNLLRSLQCPSKVTLTVPSLCLGSLCCSHLGAEEEEEKKAQAPQRVQRSTVPGWCFENQHGECFTPLNAALKETSSLGIFG